MFKNSSVAKCTPLPVPAVAKLIRLPGFFASATTSGKVLAGRLGVAEISTFDTPKMVIPDKSLTVSNGS